MSENKKPAGLFGTAFSKNKRNKRAANFSKKRETAPNVSSHATIDSNNDLDVAVPATVDACNKSGVAVPALIGPLGPIIQADVLNSNLVCTISKRHATVNSNNDLDVAVPATVDARNKSSVAVPTTVDVKIESGVALSATAVTSGVVVVPAFGKSIGSDASVGLHVPAIECTVPIDPIIEADVLNASPVSVGSPFFGFTPPQGDEFLSDDEPFFGFSPQKDFSLKRKSVEVICNVNDAIIAQTLIIGSDGKHSVEPVDQIIEAVTQTKNRGSALVVDQASINGPDGTSFVEPVGPIIEVDASTSKNSEPIFDFSVQKDFPLKRKSVEITCDVNRPETAISPLMKKGKFHEVESPKEGSSKMLVEPNNTVEHEITVVFGDFCQYDMVAIESVDFQCSGMAVCALLYTAVKLITEWDSIDLNQILNIGHEFYKNSLMQSKEQSEGMKFVHLKPYKLLQQLEINDRCYNIHVSDSSYEGNLEKNELFDALEYLNRLQTNYAMLQINNLSYGLIIYRIDDTITYVLFDSHGRDHELKRSRCYSAIIFFYNANSLVQLLLDDFQYASGFEIIPVNFEITVECNSLPPEMGTNSIQGNNSLIDISDIAGEHKKDIAENVPLGNEIIRRKSFSNIVFGDFSQFSNQFPFPHHQCTAMAATALAYACIQPVTMWKAHDLNRILYAGQIYYENCFSKLTSYEATYDSTYIEAMHLIQNLEICSIKMQVFVDTLECRGGPHDTKDNLVDAIQNFEKHQFTNGILTYKHYSYGLLRCEANDGSSSYVFFDSHGRHDDGRKNGKKSAILFFENVDDFIEFFLNEFPLLAVQDRHDLSSYMIIVPLLFLNITNEDEVQPIIPAIGDENSHRPLFTKVVSGSFAQNDNRFGVRSRNSQCTANSVVFLAFASVLEGKWTGIDIDQILMLGDHIYTVSYETATKIQRRPNSFLAAHEIVQRIFVTVSRFDCGVVTAICKPLTEKEFSGNFGKFALRYIERFFVNYTSGVFICSSLSVALHRFENQYIIFDPHARNSDGIQQSDGTANIFIFPNIQSLYHFLSKYGGYNTEREFTLTPFKISHENDANERAKVRGAPTKNLIIDGDDFCSDDDDIPLPQSPEWDDSDNIPLNKLIKPTVVITDDVEIDSGSEAESITSVRSMPESKSKPMFLSFSPAYVEKERRKVNKLRNKARNRQSVAKVSLTSEAEQKIHKRWRAYLEKHRRTHTPKVFMTKQELKDFYMAELNDGCDDEIVKATDIALANLLLIEEHRRLRMLHTTKFPKHFQAFGNHENIDESNKTYELHTLSLMNKVCEFCGAKYFKEETNTKKQFTMCCNLGEIHSDLRVKQATNYPHLLKTLLSGQSPLSAEFMQNILLYNNVLSFASMGTTDFRHLSASGSIGPVVAVQGMIYHIAEHFRTNSTGEGMPTAQLYYVDTNNAVDERLRRQVTLNRSLLIQLEVLMRTINPLADAYRMLSEVLNEVRRRPNGNATEVNLQIVRNRNAIQIRQNYGGDFGLPTSNEVAAVYTERPNPLSKNLVIFPVDKPAEDGISIHSTDPNRDPMMYPLLFPKGEQTWSYNLLRRQKGTEKEEHKDAEKGEEEHSEQEEDFEQEEEIYEEEVSDGRKTKKRVRITLREFFCYLFMVTNLFSPLLNAGKLSQQYIIDAYSRCQENTFEYLESPRGQAQIRAETYGALMDFIEKKKVFQPDIPGKIIVMPMHIAGSRQYMKEKYSDAMAMVTRFGKPTFFLTMTCNPMWEDIRKNLPKNANPIDHPGIVARVFRAKQKAFIEDLEKNHVMGKFVAYVSVIEWQKRSLPHCHLMLWVTEEDKPANPLDIDSFVSAEIPDQKENPRLYKAVTSFMYHHRCDTGDNASCLRPNKFGKGNECSKHFPRNFDDQSKLVEGSYPIYRRRQNGRAFMSVKGQEIDNKWIVPYNPYLLLKYNCHLNVEIVSSLKSLKYLFKYFHKGLDMARLRVEIIDNVQVFNEFHQYVDTRYLSSGEAIWKIYGLPVFQKSHTVYALPVHLENYQRVIFNVDNPEAALDHPESKLTAFFKLNQVDPVARQYLYTDIPYHYVYNEQKRIWTNRKRGKIVTRIHIVNYNNIELYSLRMLLYVVKGPQSYEDIRKVNGVQYDTFRKAAIALGLLEDDSLTIETFKEIIHVEPPNRIRCLFAQMLLWCTPSDPLAIWNEFKTHMYEDYVQRQCSAELSEKLALKHLSYLLTAEGQSNSAFELPEPNLSREDLQQAEATNVPLSNARTFDRAQEENDGKQLSGMLNSDQRCIFDTIMDSVHNRNAADQQKLFFVDGPGGTGKTFLFSALISSMRGLGLNVLATAWTGIAAILMKGGKTAHSAFKFPFNISGAFSCGISIGSDYANELKKIDVIIWDEISMTLSHALDAVDAFFRILMKNDLPFGGKIFCCTGDFRQILPIVQGGSKADILAVLVKRSKVWALLQKHALSVNVRLTNANDLAFARWQLDIGEGKLQDYPANEYYNGYVRIPAECIEPNSIVDRIYGKTFKSSDIDKYSNTAILTTLNEDVEFLNKAIYSRMTEDVPTETCYYSTDKVNGIAADDDDAYDVTMLNSLQPSNMAPHELKLKENCLISLLRNVNPSQGLCNGTRLIVTKLYKTCIRAKIITGDFKGEEVLLSRYRMTSKTIDTSGELERVQFPVRVCFGMSFNKAQGQTFDTTGIYLRKPPFAHGQLFVAMSRGRSKEKLIAQVLPGPFMGKLKADCEDVFVPNIVYKEVL